MSKQVTVQVKEYANGHVVFLLRDGAPYFSKRFEQFEGPRGVKSYVQFIKDLFAACNIPIVSVQYDT